MCARFSCIIFIIKRCYINLYWRYVFLYMFNICILCLYKISYVRPSKKETSFSSRLFLS